MIFTLLIIMIIVIILFVLAQNYKMYTYKYYPWNKCLINDQNKLINTFNKYGCVIIPNILTHSDCDKILELIEKEEKNKNNITSSINSNYKRKDLLLSLNKMKYDIKDIYTTIKYFCDNITPNGKIVECSSLISYPGCYPQIWHSDTNFISNNEGNLVSFGIALNDITPQMGPLEIYLESNNIYKNIDHLIDKFNIDTEDNLNGNYDDGIKKQPIEDLCKILKFKKKKCSCQKGSLIIWSSKIIHRGGANNEKKRPVFYFSVLGEGEKPYGATYSLKNNTEYIQKL